MAINYWQRFEPDILYHIYNRTISDLKLFQLDSDYRFFLQKYNKYFQLYFETYAYCLMPNHFHFLVKLKSKEMILKGALKEDSQSAFKLLEGKISVDQFIVDQFRRFLSSISIKYNNKYNRRGPVLMKRFKRVALSTGKLNYMVCYIHHNPIHHGYSVKYECWKYSSYNTYLSKLPTSVDREVYLESIGGLTEFTEMHGRFKVSQIEE